MCVHPWMLDVVFLKRVFSSQPVCYLVRTQADLNNLSAPPQKNKVEQGSMAQRAIGSSVDDGFLAGPPPLLWGRGGGGGNIVSIPAHAAS